jgi:DNA-binding NtrC family response regulator
MGNERILLVDDEEDFIRVLAERMEARGLRVDTAVSGAEGLDKVESKNFDAIILDLAMPGIDGIETLKRMREQNPDLQIILLTGHATVDKGVEAMKLGAVDFLEKPADIEKLMTLIKLASSKKMVLVAKRSEEQIDAILKKKGW